MKWIDTCQGIECYQIAGRDLPGVDGGLRGEIGFRWQAWSSSGWLSNSQYFTLPTRGDDDVTNYTPKVGDPGLPTPLQRRFSAQG